MSKEELDELVRKRGIVRSSVTKAINKAERLLDVGSKSGEALADVEALLEVLTAKQEQLEGLDSQVELSDQLERIEDEQEQSQAYSLRARRTMKLLEKFLASVSTTVKPVSLGHGASPAVMLPKRQLPRFDGTISAWQTFWDQFSSAIDSNPSLSDIDKFNYLLESVTDSARASIRGFAVTAANYEAALDTLKNRFGKPELIVRDLMAQISDLRLTDTSLSGLQRFHDDISAATRSLENQGVSASSYEALLLPNLLRRCPSDFRLELHRSANHSQKSIDSVGSLLECLKDEIDIRQAAGVDSRKPMFNNPSRDANFSPTHKVASASALVSQRTATFTASKPQLGTRQTSQTHSRVFCTYCKQDHISEHCSTMVSPDERREFLKKNNRCFKCLRPGHAVKTCDSLRPCHVCSGPHHPSVCNYQSKQSPDRGFSPRKFKEFTARKGQCMATVLENVQNSDAKSSADSVSKASAAKATIDSNTTCAAHIDSTTATAPTAEQMALPMYIQRNPAVVLPVAKAVLLSSDGQKELLVRVLLDTASNRTYVRGDVCNLLGITPTEPQRLQISAFSGLNSVVESGKVSLSIRKIDSLEIIRLNANVVSEICQPQRSVLSHSYEHLRNLDLADPFDPRDAATPISILVGSDQYFQIVSDQVVRGDTGPVAMATKLGYVLCGPLTVSGEDRNASTDSNVACAGVQVLCCDTREVPIGDEQLSTFWKLETLGITDPALQSEVEPFHCSPNFIKDRYSVNLPWKEAKDILPLKDHFDVSYRRLRSTINKLSKNPEHAKKYSEIIEEQESSGIIERVPPEDLRKPLTTVHYLPHSYVTKSDSEHTKLRIVYDGSARSHKGDSSINDLLQVGPNEFPQIPALLIRFRWRSVAVLADIEKAFLQVAINLEDRDYLRFLWYQSMNSNNDNQVVHYRFCRVPFGLTCSPALLKVTILHHLESLRERFPSSVQTLSQDLYVDNLVTSCDSVTDALNLRQDAKQLFQAAGMNMRQWQSNSLQFHSHIPMEDVGHVSKVLGLNWNAEKDVFKMDFHHCAKAAFLETPSKRSILKFLAKIYDPLGFLSPIVTIIKFILQQLSIRKISWDEEIPMDILQTWIQWLRSLESFHLEVPRFLFQQAPDQIMIHGFCDASERAFAACIYITALYGNNRTSSNLLIAKTRVAPITPLSISRLELLGALILARLMQLVTQNFQNIRRVFWTDSMNALQWIKNESKQRKIFIENRVKEIRRLSSPSEWNHVAGDNNPADLPSRGCMPEALWENEMWLHGPAFIQSFHLMEQPSTQLDTSPVPVPDPVSSTPAEAVDIPHPVHTLVATVPDRNYSIGDIIDIQTYSSWRKLIRVSAWVRRFIRNCKASVDPSGTDKYVSSSVTAEEILEAEKIWLLNFQKTSFKAEFEHLTSKAAATRLSRSLRLFLDDHGLLRCQGRLPATFPLNTNSPILLPRHSYIEKLIILHCHEWFFMVVLLIHCARSERNTGY